MTVSRRTVAVLLRRLTAAMRREGKKNVKGFNTRCQPALVRSRAARSTWSVPHPVQRAGASGRTVTAAHRMRSRRATSVHQRHGARGRTSSAACDVSGCRWAGATSMVHVAAYREVHQTPSPPAAVGSRTLPASRVPHPPLKRDVWEGRASWPAWPMSPDSASEAGRRNRPEAHRTRAARRRTSRTG